MGGAGEGLAVGPRDLGETPPSLRAARGVQAGLQVWPWKSGLL